MTISSYQTSQLTLSRLIRTCISTASIFIFALYSYAQSPSIDWTTAFIVEQFDEGLSAVGTPEKGVDVDVTSEGAIQISVIGEHSDGFTWGERYFPDQIQFDVDDIDRVEIYDSKLAFWCKDREPCISTGENGQSKLIMAGIGHVVRPRFLNASIQAFNHLIGSVSRQKEIETDESSAVEVGL